MVLTVPAHSGAPSRSTSESTLLASGAARIPLRVRLGRSLQVPVLCRDFEPGDGANSGLPRPPTAKGGVGGFEGAPVCAGGLGGGAPAGAGPPLLQVPTPSTRA
jgi:hypothetical protein